MNKKHRAPHEQLLAAGKQARKMLQEKGFEAKESILDKIMQTEGMPILPGIPTYLPHRWTLKKAQQIMYDLLLLWKQECEKKGKKKDPENITEFFKFVVGELRKQELVYEKEIARMPKLLKSLKNVPVLKDVFLPADKKDTVHAIQRFFIDSFAVAIVLKNNHATSEYANWFLDWTQELDTLWLSQKERDTLKAP